MTVISTRELETLRSSSLGLCVFFVLFCFLGICVEGRAFGTY